MDMPIAELARTARQCGEALRRYRMAKGLSQTQLGAQAGLRQATISQIENGHGATRIDTLCTVLAALELELLVTPRTRDGLEDIEDIFFKDLLG